MPRGYMRMTRNRERSAGTVEVGLLEERAKLVALGAFRVERARATESTTEQDLETTVAVQVENAFGSPARPARGLENSEECERWFFPGTHAENDIDGAEESVATTGHGGRREHEEL